MTNVDIDGRTYPVLGRNTKTDKVKAAQSQGRHVPNGFPHYSSRTGLCMCLDLCCQGNRGCKCKFCPCHYSQNDHSKLLAISGNTISSHGMDGENNG